MESSLFKALPGLQEYVPLASHTTFRIGGPARYFFVAKTSEDLVQAVQVATQQGIPYFILAGGSNVLISDRGFNGLVIVAQNTNYKIQDTKVWAEAGVDVATIVLKTGEKGLAGLEWAGGLPGTIGGAVRGNAGAFGGEIKDSLIEAKGVDQKGVVQKFSHRDCKFSYRSSLFKEQKLLVLSATFQLTKGDTAKVQQVAQEHINYRKEKHPLEYPNAGSIFKNCDVKNIPASLQSLVASVVKTDPFPVVPTAFLIAEAGLQGLRVGNAQVSEKHPNYIVNLGAASAHDVLELIQKVKQAVQKKFSVELEQEIQFLE
jgi:UDP-N-acetylmuramate dehydrogenase